MSFPLLINYITKWGSMSYDTLITTISVESGKIQKHVTQNHENKTAFV